MNKVAIKCVKVIEGQDTCTIGFVPRVSMSLPKVQQRLNKFAQVCKIHSSSKNTYKHSKSKANHSMALVQLLPEDSGGMEQ